MEMNVKEMKKKHVHTAQVNMLVSILKLYPYKFHFCVLIENRNNLHIIGIAYHWGYLKCIHSLYIINLYAYCILLMCNLVCIASVSYSLWLDRLHVKIYTLTRNIFKTRGPAGPEAIS